MLKVIPPNSYHFDEPRTRLIKLAKCGLRGTDRKEFAKVASARLVDTFTRLSFLPGEVPIYLIALGTTETIGPNRNGDGFRGSVCRKYHSTFVKHARWNRFHRNRNPAESYGIVKASTFNEDMGRIELIVALNGDRRAAARTGGRVADLELEKLANGDELPVSMACHVSFDICSSCGNRATNRAEYCDESRCPHGGLKRNLAKVFEDGHILHADNPNPTFFDISLVVRPADRIAYVLGTDVSRLSKVASGTELAERWHIQWPPTPEEFPQATRQQKLVEKLAALERRPTARIRQACLAFQPQVWTVEAPAIVGEQDTLFSVLAEKHCLLPPEGFFGLFGPPWKAAAVGALVRQHLPTVFSSLLRNPASSALLAENPYLPQKSGSLKLADWTVRNIPRLSLELPYVAQRLSQSFIRAPKAASVQALPGVTTEVAEQLAQQYALYQLGFLEAHWQHPRLPEFMELTVAANLGAARKN